MHPVSPLLGAWSVFAIVAAGWAYTRAPDWVTEDDDIPDIPDGVVIPNILFLIGGILIAGVVVGFAYVAWSFTYYRIGDDAVYYRSGVISRQHVQARLNRLQAVDVVQPLIARIFGFAKLRIEVAGGEGSATEIAFLRAGDADALRNEILLLAAGHAAPVAEDSAAIAEAAQQLGQDPAGMAPLASDGAAVAATGGDAPRPSLAEVARGVPEGLPATPAAPHRDVYHVPTSRLLLSLVLSGPFVVLVSLPVVVAIVVLGFGWELDNILAVALGGGLLTTLPVVIGFIGYFWSRLTSGFGFTAAVSQDGIRLKHGMLETRRQTVPPGRVQAVQLRQPLLWRRKDWWRITINVAGYQDQTEAVSTLLPVGTRQEALTALWLVLPDLGDPDPAGTISVAMTGVRDEGGFVGSPTRSWCFAWFEWRHRGVRATEKALLVRRGWLTRDLSVVPHERTQSLALTQGPLERLFKLANIVVHSTKGPVNPVAHHLAVDDAVVILDDQARRAREGRHRQTPEQWMAAVGLRER